MAETLLLRHERKYARLSCLAENLLLPLLHTVKLTDVCASDTGANISFLFLLKIKESLIHK